MNWYALPPLITAAIILLIGLFVLSRDKKSNINIVFSLFCLSMVIWLSGYSLMYLSSDPISALRFARIGFVGIIFLPILSFHFTIAFLELRVRRWAVYLLYLQSIPLLIFSQTNIAYDGIEKYFWGFYPTAGPFYMVYFLECILLFCWGAFLLYKAYKKAVDLKLFKRSQQIKYVLIAVLAGPIGSVDYLIKFKVPIYPYGYICALFFISVIAYAITRYKLMDIEVVVRKGLIYSFLTAIITTAFLGVIYISEVFLKNLAGYSIVWISIPSIFLFSLIFQPLKDWIQDLVDSKFFKTKYEIDKIIKSFSLGLKRLIVMSDLAKFVNATATKTFGLKGSAFFVIDREKNSYACIDASGDLSGLSDRTIDAGSGVVSSLLKAGASVPAGNRLRVPVISEKGGPGLLGFFIFSGKLSEDDFSVNDIALMEMFANQTAISIENALLLENEKNTAKRLAQAQMTERIATIARMNISLQHEINNPLTGALAQTQILSMKMKDCEQMNSEKALPMLQTIEKELIRIRELLKSLEKMTDPAITEYMPGVEMIDIGRSTGK